jgi:2,3,4,5-tetrahydropyridine-2-carboxylate N-succinyltransferase
VVDVTGSEPIEHRGEVPPAAVVVPGTRTKTFPAGEFGVATGLIIGWRSEKHDRKISLNDALREYGVAT